MHPFDYIAISVAIVLALLAERDASKSLRGSVLCYLLNVSGDGWVRMYELRWVFGHSVYRICRGLERDGLVERKDTIGDGNRLYWPCIWYRANRASSWFSRPIPKAGGAA